MAWWFPGKNQQQQPNSYFNIITYFVTNRRITISAVPGIAAFLRILVQGRLQTGKVVPLITLVAPSTKKDYSNYSNRFLKNYINRNNSIYFKKKKHFVLSFSRVNPVTFVNWKSSRGLKDKTLGILVLTDATRPVFKTRTQIPIFVMKYIHESRSQMTDRWCRNSIV